MTLIGFASSAAICRQVVAPSRLAIPSAFLVEDRLDDVRLPIGRSRYPKAAWRHRVRPAPAKPPDQPDHLDDGQQRYEAARKETKQEEAQGLGQHAASLRVVTLR